MEVKQRFGKPIYYMTEVPLSKRWTREKPKFPDNEGSHAFRVAVGVFFAGRYMQEVEGNEEFDLLKAICYAIYHNFHTSIIGTIRHRTKNAPEVSESIKELEVAVTEEEIIPHFPEQMQTTFLDFILNAQNDNTLEGQLVEAMNTFDKMMVCYREVKYGNTYPFEEKLRELTEKLRNHPMESVRWLMKHVDDQTPFSEFIMKMMMLDTVERWGGRIADDDAIHGYRTTALAIYNCYLEKLVFGVEMDILRVLCETMFHDAPEEETDDVRAPVKHRNSRIKKSFKKLEHAVSTEWVNELIPEFLKEDMNKYMVYAKSPSYEGTMVSIVDKMDALIKAADEMVNGRGKRFERSYIKSLEEIQDSFRDNPCVVFFLAFVLHYLFLPDYE